MEIFSYYLTAERDASYWFVSGTDLGIVWNRCEIRLNGCGIETASISILLSEFNLYAIPSEL